ncbi:PREDICTED: uncharacterized protein LOC104292318 [Charadrius vociferus]|uniref:uncharacterized protein LOC104292318 n=1 Tax=Charadrius vociferus TaxID=50402 RepID=UPI0005218AF4|nr:PREDICTED: uncharacterized protein LOC104292318 [Charadrius vociferus]
MSRKRRKSCKGRKSFDSREYEQLSPICKCQQNVGSLENKADEALAHLAEPLDVKGTEEDGKYHENKNQSSSDASEDRDLDNVSDSEKEGKKEKNYTPQMFSPQQDEILATVTFGESEGSSTGKITLWGKPDSAEFVSLATGKITAEVKYGSFNVKVEVKNVSVLDSGTNLVVEKRKSSKNNKRCHERQYQKSQCSKCSKYQCPSTDHSAEHKGNYKGSSKHKIRTAINKNACLKMNIEAKEIKVEYTSRKKNLKVNIKPGEEAQSKNGNREHEDTYWSETDYSVTEAPCNTDSSNTLNNPNTGKECISRNNVLSQERKNCEKCRDMGQKPARRKSFPDTTLDVPLPARPRRDSGFCSLPSLKMLPKETKIGDICNRNSHVHTSYTELSNCSDLTSSLKSLRGLKSSYQYAFTSFDHNITIYPSEPEESLDDTCLLNDYADYGGQGEETEETLMESFHSSGTTNEKKENGHEEPLRNLAIWEEDSESTEDALDEGTPEYNHQENHVEVQNKGQLVHVFPHCRSPSGEFINDKESTNYASTESTPKQLPALQQNVHQPPAELEVTKKRRGSVMTVITGELERRLIQGDTKLIPDSFNSAVRKEPKLPCSIQEESLLSSLLLDPEEHDINNESESFSEIPDISGNILVESDYHNDSAQAAILSTSSAYTENKENFTEHSNVKERPENFCSKQSTDDSLKREPGVHQLPQLAKSNPDEVEKKIEISKEDFHQNADLPPLSVKQISQKDLKSEMNKTRKLPLMKDTRASDSSQEEAIDQWARRRKQFKDSKKCSSTGGSSINSTITEGSINSEDARSVDLGLHSENEDRGFYTENFHSASWVFRGDDVSPDNSPRCLSKRPRPVAIRERTVKIAKGTGNYPWGFRIQFSKPILVTEVDTNSAAEEAGLQVGDILIAVNGTDVTSMPHSEAANLARKGPDTLTMVVGSDISRYPNTPRPTCRGYLHKRTQSAILKGWRKRWFVLKHNGYLHYYKHKKNHVWVDVTLHNTTLPPLAIKNPECLGLLHQLDRSKDVWIQHYCILKDGCLYFYATLRSTPAQGGLYLQGYIVSEQSLGSKRSVIELKPPSEEFKTFYLCAENVNENKSVIMCQRSARTTNDFPVRKFGVMYVLVKTPQSKKTTCWWPSELATEKTLIKQHAAKGFTSEVKNFQVECGTRTKKAGEQEVHENAYALVSFQMTLECQCGYLQMTAGYVLQNEPVVAASHCQQAW